VSLASAYITYFVHITNSTLFIRTNSRLPVPRPDASRTSRLTEQTGKSEGRWWLCLKKITAGTPGPRLVQVAVTPCGPGSTCWGAAHDVLTVRSAANDGNPRNPGQTGIFTVRFSAGGQVFLFGWAFAKGKSAELGASSSWKLPDCAKIYLEAPGRTPGYGGVATAVAVSAPTPRGMPGCRGYAGLQRPRDGGAGRANDGRGV